MKCYEYFKIFDIEGKTYLSLNIIDQYDEINEKELNINLDTLQTLVDNGTITDALDFNALVENNIVSKNSLVKILGRGELKAKLKVTAHKFTATAKAAIEAAGGEAVTL